MGGSRRQSAMRRPIAVVGFFGVAGCAGGSNAPAGAGGIGGAAGTTGAAGLGGSAGGGRDGGAVPMSNVTVGGVAWPYQQGELDGPSGITIGGVPAIRAVLRDHAFDNCAAGKGANVPADPRSIAFAVPPVVGHYDLPAQALTTATGNITLDVSNAGTIDVTHVDDRTIEGTIDVTLQISRAAVRGPFVATICGWTGQDLMTGTVCTVPPAESFGGSVPDMYAVSPAGRVAVATSTNAVTVYVPTETGTTCSYAPDPTYGTGGLVTLDNHYMKVAWDDAERLYMFTQINTWVDPQQPEALFRVSPGAALESCRHLETGGPPVGSTPTYWRVLPDGSAAFLYWFNRGEWSVDLRDPDFGAGNACKFTKMTADQRHTAALSGSGDRLLFLRADGDVTRAVETDLAGNTLLTFGGTPSGFGEAGLGDVTLLSRCPTGYCAANDRMLKVFAPDGSVRQLVHLFPASPQLAPPFVLPDGLSMLARFLGPGTNGSAWLRADYATLTTGEYPDVAIHLKPKR